MGKGSRRGINKNDPNTVTFTLVNAARDDPTFKDPHSRLRLQRVIPPNAFRKGKYSEEIPESLQKLFDKKDFGIHEYLPTHQASQLKQSIYGNAAESDEEGDGDVAVPAFWRQKVNFDVDENSDALEGDCYFPCDGYDYEQHLATISKKGGVVLPFSEAKTEGAPKMEDVQQKTVKPRGSEEEEMLAALEDADLYEELNDDFVRDAQVDEHGQIHAVEDASLLWGEKYVASHRRPSDEDVELSPRTREERGRGDDGLEEKFEKVLEEYEDSDIGELNEEDVLEEAAGEEVDKFDDIFDEFLDEGKCSTAGRKKHENGDEDEALIPEKLDAEVINKIKGALLKIDENEEYEEISVEDDDESSKWDCESVLTLKSRSSNHPCKIGKPTKITAAPIHINQKLDLPEEFLEKTKQQKQDILDEQKKTQTADIVDLPEVNVYRRKGETKEEKKERKSQVKNMKRMIREIKKANAKIFKEEKLKMLALKANQNPYDLQPRTAYFKI